MSLRKPTNKHKFNWSNVCRNLQECHLQMWCLCNVWLICFLKITRGSNIWLLSQLLTFLEVGTVCFSRWLQQYNSWTMHRKLQPCLISHFKTEVSDFSCCTCFPSNIAQQSDQGAKTASFCYELLIWMQDKLSKSTEMHWLQKVVHPIEHSQWCHIQLLDQGGHTLLQ